MKPFFPDPKTGVWKSPKYLAFIRTKPSLYSGRLGTEADPIVAAHQSFGKKGTGMKVSDTQAVPLLHSEHTRWEHQKGGKRFWADQNDALPLRCLEYVTEYLIKLGTRKR